LNKKERIEAVIRHRTVDRIPWTIYRSIIPWGEAELKFRNAGLSSCYQHFPIYKVRRPNVEVREEAKFTFNKKQGRKITTRTFITPLGELSSVHEFMVDGAVNPGDFIRRFGSEIDQENLSWITKYPFHKTSDYEILEYIIKDTIYEANYEEYRKTEYLVGSEGVVMANIGRCPFQSILYELMGPEKCFLEFYERPKRFQGLYELIFEKEKEKYKIAADSPTTIIWYSDNLTGTLTSPHFFKKFCLPSYDELTHVAHNKGKVVVVHMDGYLRPLVDLITETKIDVIEAFTPPPMGNLPVSEARAVWKDKVIWCNFPGTLIATSDAKTIEDYTIKLLKSVAPGENFLLGFTENFPLDRFQVAFGAIAKVLEKYGRYPIFDQ